MEKKYTFNSPSSVRPASKKLNAQKLKALMRQGEAQIKAGDYALASKTFSSILTSQPKSPTANYYLGFALHAQGDAAQASKYYSIAVREKPNLSQGWLNLANACMLQEQFEKAEQAFKKAVSLKKTATALNGLGMALGAQDKDDDAVRFFLDAYQLKPQEVDIRNNLMTALIKTEKYNQVIGLLEDIPDFKKDPALLRNYGVAMVGIGDAQRAQSALEDYLSMEPDNQEALYNLARLYQDQTQYEKSLEYFERLNDRDSDVKILSHMGAVLDSLGRFEEAEAVLKQALKLNSEDVAVLNHLGNAMTGGNKTADAEAMYRKAIAVNDNSALSHNNLGFALAARGLVEQAVKEYEKAIAIKPDYGESYRNLVTVKKIKDRKDPLIEKMLDQVGAHDVSESDQVQFGFALGKALDDCGDYDLAFKYYKLANDLIAKSRPFNVDSFERHVDQIIDVYTEEFFREHFGRFGEACEMPVFVLGMSRSGTTLAEKIIASHPRVQGAGELGKLFEVIKGYEQHSTMEYPQALLKPDANRLQQAARDYLDYIRKYIRSPSVNHVVDKMPYNFAHLGFIALALPNAKIIHCRRDPIDTCLSNYFQYFPRGISALYDLDQLKRYYQQYQRLMVHWRKVLPIPFYDLHYERLTADQERITREVIAFLQLDWDDACLHSHQSTSSVRTASIWQVRQPIYQKSVQRWRNYEKHIRILTDAFADQLSE